jgi:hypothetical protein
LIDLRSYKIRFHDRHVRAVPRTGLDGCPFAGPGVDLRAEEADAVIAAAAPVVAWLTEREPGVVVRSISIDKDAPRALATLEAVREHDKPRVVRIDAPQASELVAAAAGAEAAIVRYAEAALSRRGR